MQLRCVCRAGTIDVFLLYSGIWVVEIGVAGISMDNQVVYDSTAAYKRASLMRAYLVPITGACQVERGAFPYCSRIQSLMRIMMLTRLKSSTASGS